MRSQQHFDLMRMLLYKALTREGSNLIFRSSVSTPSAGEVKASIEEATKQVMRFFVEADSVDLDWLIKEDSSEAECGLDPVFFRIICDRDEHDAVEKATSDGDFRSLEKIVQERGYLRTQAARDLISAKIRGEQPSRGVSSVDKNAALEVLKIMVREKCSEYRAVQFYIDTATERGLELNENTLKSRLRRAKKDPLTRGMFAMLRGNSSDALLAFSEIQ